MEEAQPLALSTPIWIDLGSPDIAASQAFYGGLFGWEGATPDPQYGGYANFSLNGQSVAGLGPQMGPVSAWATYVSTEDAGATAQKVRDAGGQVVMEPMDVGPFGSMAVFTDPAGAFISTWQPGTHKGAELYNQPGSFGWNELATNDMEAAKRFYQSVFGWDAKVSEVPGFGNYTEWQLSGRSIGGGMEMGDSFPPGVPPHWLVYFMVADCDQTVQKAEELGGAVLSPAMDMSAGRFAVLRDQHGAAFAVIQVPSQTT